MGFLHDSVQTVVVPIDDVQERTYPIEGMEVSITTCIVSEEILDKDVNEQNVLIREIKLISKDPVFLGNLLVVYVDAEEADSKDDGRVPIVFRAEHFEPHVVVPLEEDANIEADNVRVYCLGQPVHLYEIVDVVVVSDAKEIRKDSKRIRLGRKQ